ncbi:MAG: cadherin-like domain-containing protein, partial [Planctomycetales bacterium]|nr:cadherin-like domain-containing protein [Planctomycetales bacterium]
VYVDLNSNGALDAGEPNATTDVDGLYTIADVPYGTHAVREVVPPGYTPTNPAGGVRTTLLLNGENRADFDFGNREPTDFTITGTVFHDANGNGLRDADERGLSGITIYLDLNDNGLLDAGEPVSITSIDQFFTPAVDEAGNYAFTHLARGSFQVRQVVPVELERTPAEQRVHSVSVGPLSAADVNFADQFRANEIHGVVFDDTDGDGVHDANEYARPGISIYIDLDRDDVYDPDEPHTVTGEDGSYSFVDLTPGDYVVREDHGGHGPHTYPTTSGGILWPEGTSHAAIGNVTPTSITTSLAQGESYTQTVSLTLPGAGGITNLVDVFLLFDDTGSFTTNSPIVRAAFPEIITTLQGLLPGVDLGFGVGRLEEYGGFGGENPNGRPFTLNQPIVAASNPGFSASIQAALDRTAPGFGGDAPETDIEALYQLVTGLGFDGNNNGTTTDSGAAGLASTQVTPGASGDVPAFASFTADPANGVLAPDGNIGGGGFRPGALPVILLATDTGVVYQPRGETSITGLGGLTLPLSDLTSLSRATTPFSAGAGIQDTVTALNALGALVVGLGTNDLATTAPRQTLEALAKLTGAVNQTISSVDNGTADPIDPGDPFYFKIATDFGPTVANGIVSAIQNAVTSVAVDITLRASDPRVQIINHTGTLAGVAAGDTATFDVEFIGDGKPHRFDLQFVREGTSVVLGSIPVVLGTPIVGEGYHYDDLEDGEIHRSSHFGNYVPNVAPSFTAGADQTADDSAGPQTVPGWATAISPGAETEFAQTLTFEVSSDNPSLFAAAPAVAPDGTLSFTPALNASGAALVSIVLHDDGGIGPSGSDTSAPQTFTIEVIAANEAPVAADDSGYSVDADSVLSVPVAEGVLGNDTDADGDAITASVVTGPANGSLTLNADGSFDYTPNTGFVGTDSFTYVANDGALDSNTATVTITVSEPAFPVGTTFIIDNGDAVGYSETANWRYWTPSGVYGGDAAHSREIDGVDTATWTFSGLVPGEYRVSSTWKIHPNRATNAAYEVFDGAASIANVPMNQQIAPDDFYDATSDWTWEDLGGPYMIAGDTLTVTLTDLGADGYVIADAVRIEFLAPAADGVSITATDADKPEGASGTTDFTFTVTRTGDVSGAASVDYAVTGSGANPANAADFGG